MKTNLDTLFKTDQKLEKDGLWFEIESIGAGFLMRPFKGTNPNVKSAMAQLYKPFAKQIEMGTLGGDKEREILIKLFCRVSLIDWKGIEIDGKIVEYSEAVAIPFFVGLPDLFDTLWTHCQDFKNYLADVGNYSADA